MNRYLIVIVFSLMFSSCLSHKSWRHIEFSGSNQKYTFSDDDNIDHQENRTIDISRVSVQAKSPESYIIHIEVSSINLSKYNILHADIDIDRNTVTGYDFYGIGVDSFHSFTKDNESQEWSFNKTIRNKSFSLESESISIEENSFAFSLHFADGFDPNHGFNFRIRAVQKDSRKSKKSTMDVSPVFTVKFSPSQSKAYVYRMTNFFTDKN